MTSQTLDRRRQSRDNHDSFAVDRAGFGNAEHSDWGHLGSTNDLRPIRDLLVRQIKAAEVNSKPGWIVQIGANGFQWTECIGRTMKSLHTEPGRSRPKLAIVDGSPSALQSATEELRLQCLPEPDALRICHDGRFSLDGTADVVFSFNAFAEFDLEVIANYFGTVARIIHPNGKFLVALACEFDPTRADADVSNDIRECPVFWSSEGPQFAEKIRAIVDRYFTLCVADVIPLQIGAGQVFVEFTRNAFQD